MELLKKNNKNNLLYTCALALCNTKPGTDEPVFPMDRMPFEYQIEFFSCTHIRQVRLNLTSSSSYFKACQLLLTNKVLRENRQCSLGVQWDAEHDVFKFQVTNLNKPNAKRGILSTFGSLYDPLGLVCPVVLEAKQIMQRLWRAQMDWD